MSGFAYIVEYHCTYPIGGKAGQDDYENQCAMRVSYALKNAGFNMEEYTKAKTSDGLARGAESLARYLRERAVPPDRYGRNDARKLSNREGILFLDDIDNFSNGRGDHLGLWDGEKLLSDETELFERSQQVWFWEIRA